MREPPHYDAGDELNQPFTDPEEMVEPYLAPLDLGPTRPHKPSMVDEMSRSRWLVLVLVLGGLSAFGPLSVDMYLPALPSIADELGGGASGVQLTLTAVLAGLALGQLIAGPLSDQLGRRMPLMVGVSGYAAASLACAFAPSVGVLVALRFLQGLGGAAGIVIARAVVRDLYEGVAAARFFSRLMLVTGLAPIFAPIFGAQVLRFTDWRGVFWVLAGIGVVLVIGVAVGVPETWPVSRRSGAGVGTTLRRMFGLTRDRVLMGYALASGLAFAAMFAYISGSPFVIQEIYGASPQFFSIVFGVNAFGLAAAGQLNAQLVARISPQRLLHLGLGITFVSGLALLVVVAFEVPGLAALLPPLFFLVTSMGLIFPNATALALAEHPEAAGSASALLGVLQFIVGAAVAPLVGIAGEGTALPMAVLIAILGMGALLAHFFLSRPAEERV